MYVGGMSSSLPEDVQHEMYRTLPGMEHVKIVRNAYAIEYDCINPDQLYASLEFKKKTELPSHPLFAPAFLKNPENAYPLSQVFPS